jgi:GrpB-like predicted nucleotidyltransferase (UPF0157 family)
MLRTPALDVHVHVLPAGDPEIRRHLVFREALSSDPDTRARYEQLKRELSRQDWVDMNEYADAKGPFIEGVIAAHCDRLGA